MSDYFSLQFLEKIEGLDSDTPTINGDKELALPTPMKTLLKSFLKKFKNDRPTFYISPVGWDSSKYKALDLSIAKIENWKDRLKNEFQVMESFKFNSKDNAWTIDGERSHGSGNYDYRFDCPTVIVFENRHTVPRPMGIIKLEKDDTYGKSNCMRFTWKARAVETDKGETSSSGIGKLLKKVTRNATDEHVFYDKLRQTVDENVDFRSFFSNTFCEDWLVCKENIDDDFFKKGTYNRPDSSPSHSSTISQHKLARIVLSLAKKAMPEEVKQIETDSYGYTGDVSKFQLSGEERSTLTTMVKNWSYLEKQRKVRNENLAKFGRYYIYIPIGENATYGWIKMTYSQTAKLYDGKPRKEMEIERKFETMCFLEQLDVDTDEGLNILTVQGSQDLVEFANTVAKKKPNSSNDSFFDHDTQIGILPIEVCTYDHSFAFIVGGGTGEVKDDSE